MTDQFEQEQAEVPVQEEAASAGAASPPDADAAAAPDDHEGAAQQVEQDIDELSATERERNEYLALAQRTKADFENYRKRMTRDLRAAEARGVGRTVQQLVGAIDNLEIAVRNLDPADREGDSARALTLARDELLGGLARCGVEHYWPEGEAFDPTLHEAMTQQPADGLASGTIVSVYQRGYRVEGNVLRPARVVVAS